MSMSPGSSTITLSSGDRTQILSNAMLLFPHIVHSHIRKHGIAAIDPAKIFDIVYSSDGDTGSRDPAQNLYRDSLVARSADDPTIC